MASHLDPAIEPSLGRPSSSRNPSRSSSRSASDSYKASARGQSKDVVSNGSSANRYRIDSNTRGGRKARRRNKESSSGLDGLSNLALKQPSICEDVNSLIGLSMPIIVTMVPWVAMKTTDTAIVGHLGTQFLIAYSMSELWTSATGVMLNGSVLGVFVGKAVAAGEYGFAGEWLQVSLVVVGFISLLVAGSWACTGAVLTHLFHADEDIAKKAQYYSLIFIIAIPARVILTNFTQFYRVQQHSFPSVISGIFATIMNLIFAVIFVLGEPSSWFQSDSIGFGFVAAPIVPVLATYLQLFIMYLISPRLENWPGWSISHITKHRVVEFLREYLPSSFSSASDWWRYAAIGIITASCSYDDLAVFIASYRLLWISLIFTGSISAATGVKLSIALSSGDPIHAKTLTLVGILLACPVILSLTAIYFFFPQHLARIFTNNDQLIQGFVNIKYSFSCVVALMNLNVVLERIPLSMNRGGLINTVGLLSSWIVQVPAVLLLTHFWRDDLVGVYTGVAIGYAFLDLLLVIVIVSSNYEAAAKDAMERALGYLVSDTVSSVSSKSKSTSHHAGSRFRAPVGELERIASMDGSNHRPVHTPSPFANIAEYEEAFLQSSQFEEEEYDDPGFEGNQPTQRLDYNAGIPPPRTTANRPIKEAQPGSDPSSPSTINIADVTF